MDVLLSLKQDLAAARAFFVTALRAGTVPVEITTDRAATYPPVLDELVPAALHTVEQHANNPVETAAGSRPVHVRGVVGGQPGLYLVGLHSLHAASSAQISGVGRDAYHVVKDIASRMSQRHAADVPVAT